jgi:hypothetical protein
MKRILWFAIMSWNLANLGKAMDAAAITNLIKQMDASLPKGQIYHIDYTIVQENLNAFYERRRQMIAFLQGSLNAATKEGPGDVAAIKRQETQQNLINSYTKEMKLFRKRTCVTGYTVDGAGFYMEQASSWIGASGEVKNGDPAIYVSDGKVMGTFYPASSQAVVQPASQRPRCPDNDWTEPAYLVMRRTLGDYMDGGLNMKLAETKDSFVIATNFPGEQGVPSTVELCINKASLEPEKLEANCYKQAGMPSYRLVKTWEFQDFGGLRLPKNVVQQEYYRDLNGNLNLETVNTFTISRFTLSPPFSGKDKFAALLRQNYSVFDEITGTHYLAGSPSAVLDNLSK